MASPYTEVVSKESGPYVIVQRFPRVTHNHGGHLRDPSRFRSRATPVECHLRPLKLPLAQGSINLEYADKTLIVGTTVNEVQVRTNAAFDIVSKDIRSLGLCLAIDKTQAVVFSRRRR